MHSGVAALGLVLALAWAGMELLLAAAARCCCSGYYVM